MSEPPNNEAAGDGSRRLCVFNGGLLAKGRVRRMLELAGWQVTLGRPGEGDAIGVWGKSPTAPRGEKVADWTGAPIVRVEDALLRSLNPGRAGEAPLGLLVDDLGLHFDSSAPSRIEDILANHPFDDTALLNRARGAMSFMADNHLSKYAAVDPDLEPPAAGYVLVIDQTRGDASVEMGGASATTFREMLVAARLNHPDAEIVIKSHPETNGGHREGYYNEEDETDGVRILRDPVSPWRLFEHARSVYTVSSGLGFEAIMGGHKPFVFGQPFYAGWGLTIDENPVARRERRLTKPQLFAGAMIEAPIWYDPYRDRLCEVEDAMRTLAAHARAWREDRGGWVMTAISRHKRSRMKAVFGRHGDVQFADPDKAITFARRSGRPLMGWSAKMPDDLAEKAQAAGVALTRVEDGFLRSRGLGAALVPAMSMTLDRQGIYYDPLYRSDLEGLIEASVDLPPAALDRAARLIGSLSRLRLSKYNQGGAAPDTSDWPDGPRVLVVGQVADDASVIKGCAGGIATDAELLRAAQTGAPNATLIYKPHPDVLAGFREGGEGTEGLADVTLGDVDPIDVLDEVEAVWTLSSLLGFEALLRGLPVTCAGTPFYAGWGLTRDYGKVPGRRTARPSLEGLVHAVLIDYPRYFDPVTGDPCPVEVVVERLAEGGEGGGVQGAFFTLFRRMFRR